MTAYLPAEIGDKIIKAYFKSWLHNGLVFNLYHTWPASLFHYMLQSCCHKISSPFLTLNSP